MVATVAADVDPSVAPPEFTCHARIPHIKAMRPAQPCCGQRAQSLRTEIKPRFNQRVSLLPPPEICRDICFAANANGNQTSTRSLRAEPVPR
jgi:hypothetical protein